MPSEWTSAKAFSHWNSPWKLINEFFDRGNCLRAVSAWSGSLGEQGCSNAPRYRHLLVRRIDMASPGRLYHDKIRKMRSIWLQLPVVGDITVSYR
jgi:hypothetical protein